MAISYEITESPDCLGHHFIIGLSGPNLSEHDKRVLGTLRPAGVLIDQQNFAQAVPYNRWLEKLTELMHDIHEYAERETMLISLDHEGGTFTRTPPPITRFPPPLEYRDRVKDVATAMCEEVKSLGINTLWAPVADINWNPANPVIGARAFGSRVDDVLQPIVDTITTYRECGVLSCAKHFPGHGGTSVDSHHALPFLDLTLNQLRERDLAPFGAAVAAGVPLIMSAHIQYPQIDRECPATLSSRIMRDILRDDLHFRGVIVADNLDMAAVSNIFKGVRPLLLALEASVDVFIVSKNTSRAEFLAREALNSLRRGEIKESVLQRSHTRIDATYSALKRYPVTKLADEVFSKHSLLARG